MGMSCDHSALAQVLKSASAPITAVDGRLIACLSSRRAFV